MYCLEWPPKITACTNCQAVLKLVGFDPSYQSLAYRKI